VFEVGIAFMLVTISAVTMIIALFIFIDSRKEMSDRTEKMGRNFGFPRKNIDIDRKDEK
jgi:hypothetical protein